MKSFKRLFAKSKIYTGPEYQMVPYINTPQWQKELAKNQDKDDLAVEKEYLEFRQAIIKRAEAIFKKVEVVAKNYIDDFRKKNRSDDEISRHEIETILWKSNDGLMWDGSSRIDNLIVKRRWRDSVMGENDLTFFCEKCLDYGLEFDVSKMDKPQTEGLDKYIKDNLDRFVEAWQEDLVNQEQKKKIDAIELKSSAVKTPRPSRRVLK